MTKRKNDSDVAVMEPEETVTSEAAEVPPVESAAVEPTGPIIEPPDAEYCEKLHYEQIKEVNVLVRQAEEEAEAAKRHAKMKKDAFDEASSQLSALISRGPDCPPRRYAKKVKLTCDVEADTELGEGFITVPAGTEFEVQEIKDQSVVVLVQGKANALDIGEYTVIEWQTFAPGSTIAPTTTSTEQPEVYADAWRTASLSELALPAGVLGKLEEANVTTVGQLEDLRAEISNARAVWPKGIGEAKITLIEERIINWLSLYRDSWGQAIEGDTEIEDGEEASE